jgi:hypothetical protein
MPIRDKFPSEYFAGNPYEGLSPEEIYQKLQWGNDPKAVFEVDAPEPLVTLGDVAMLVSESEQVEFTEDEAPFLALGVESNRLYIVPKDENGEPIDVPEGPYEEVCQLVQTDYYSEKGGDDAYYFHEHEAPYPTLYIHLETGVMLVEPAETGEGVRSYAVSDEGVIG